MKNIYVMILLLYVALFSFSCSTNNKKKNDSDPNIDIVLGSLYIPESTDLVLAIDKNNNIITADVPIFLINNGEHMIQDVRFQIVKNDNNGVIDIDINNATIVPTGGPKTMAVAFIKINKVGNYLFKVNYLENGLKRSINLALNAIINDEPFTGIEYISYNTFSNQPNRYISILYTNITKDKINTNDVLVNMFGGNFIFTKQYSKNNGVLNPGETINVLYCFNKPEIATNLNWLPSHVLAKISQPKSDAAKKPTTTEVGIIIDFAEPIGGCKFNVSRDSFGIRSIQTQLLSFVSLPTGFNVSSACATLPFLDDVSQQHSHTHSFSKYSPYVSMKTTDNSVTITPTNNNIHGSVIVLHESKSSNEEGALKTYQYFSLMAYSNQNIQIMHQSGSDDIKQFRFISNGDALDVISTVTNYNETITIQAIDLEIYNNDNKKLFEIIDTDVNSCKINKVVAHAEACVVHVRFKPNSKLIIDDFNNIGRLDIKYKQHSAEMIFTNEFKYTSSNTIPQIIVNDIADHGVYNLGVYFDGNNQYPKKIDLVLGNIGKVAIKDITAVMDSSILSGLIKIDTTNCQNGIPLNGSCVISLSINPSDKDQWVHDNLSIKYDGIIIEIPFVYDGNGIKESSILFDTYGYQMIGFKYDTINSTYYLLDQSKGGEVRLMLQNISGKSQTISTNRFMGYDDVALGSKYGVYNVQNNCANKEIPANTSCEIIFSLPPKAPIGSIGIPAVYVEDTSSFVIDRLLYADRVKANRISNNSLIDSKNSKLVLFGVNSESLPDRYVPIFAYK